VTDFYVPATSEQPQHQLLSSVRYGVAIDRVTGAVAQGPFELEVVTDGLFCGTITVRNFTLGQLGLVAASILDMSDGLVALGYGKSRGLGRVQVGFRKFAVRTLTNPNGALLGVGALCGDETVRTNFELPAVDRERCDVQANARREAGFWVVSTEGQQARQWLEQLAPRWLEEIAA
jgi:CRISPR/Cas system CSM-associated protein Csm3 (group 7 of RAMP superfamily)